jgi:hypothetical protein
MIFIAMIQLLIQYAYELRVQKVAEYRICTVPMPAEEQCKQLS